MKKSFYIDGINRPLQVDLALFWKQGEEARVIKLADGQLPNSSATNLLLKVYKQADDPDYEGNDPEKYNARQAAIARLRTLQTKLPSFPSGFPATVAAFQDLLFDGDDIRTRRIAALTMPTVPDPITLHKFSDGDYQPDHQISRASVLNLFTGLHQTVAAVHKLGVVIGDFNSFNVLVQTQKWVAHLVDVDSFQIDNYPCLTYTPNYSDPLILKWDATTKWDMKAPHSMSTDDYGLALHIWEGFLGYPLYGGVHRPKNPADKIPFERRPLHRISVLHPDVALDSDLPQPNILPDEWLAFYKDLVEKDRRETFPLRYLTELRFRDDGSAYLAITSAPVPPRAPIAKPATKPTAPASNAVLVATTSLVNITGTIVHAAYQNGGLTYVYHQDGAYHRATLVANSTGGFDTIDQTKIGPGQFDPDIRFGISGQSTLMSKSGRTFVLKAGVKPSFLAADLYLGDEPVFAANGSTYYWPSAGAIWRYSDTGPKNIATAFDGHTKLFTGEKFGFGYHLTDSYTRAFIFTTDSGKVEVDQSVIYGNIITDQCTFTDDNVWLLLKAKVGRRVVNRCALIDKDGRILALPVEAPDGDDSWLGSLSGKCAATLRLPDYTDQEALLVATREGIIKITRHGRALEASQPYAGTAGLVSPNDHLIHGQEGLFAWNAHQIQRINIAAW